jgi:hypothetical protein
MGLPAALQRSVRRPRNREGTIKLWYTPTEWSERSTTRVPYQSVSKEWVAYGGVECFATPTFEPDDGIQISRGIFGPDVEGKRSLNPENPGSYIARARKNEQDFMGLESSLAVWEGPRQTQEQFNRGLAEISSRAEPLNAKFADFLDQYSKEEMLATTLGLAPVESGFFRLWALVFYHGGRS